MSPAPRSLPIRYAPYPGEALDSWMEAVAARLNCPFTDVLSALGLPNRDPAAAALVLPRWTTLATPDELTAITEATGVPVDVLAAMTLQPYDGHAVVIVAGQRRVHRQLPWGRPGSRFCPACLEETGGRWQVTWRLGWSFACTRHHVLLADRCPACLRSPAPALPPPPGGAPPRSVLQRIPGRRAATRALPPPPRRHPGHRPHARRSAGENPGAHRHGSRGPGPGGALAAVRAWRRAPANGTARREKSGSSGPQSRDNRRPEPRGFRRSPRTPGALPDQPALPPFPTPSEHPAQ
ncbi:TniQ family protein [Streptomyces olivaceus]